MTQKEIETELVRVGNDFAIPLPLTFVEGTTLSEGASLKVVYNERGNLEVQVNKVSSSDGKCQLCGGGTARYECSVCHSHACSSCFWEWGGLCNKCTKK